MAHVHSRDDVYAISYLMQVQKLSIARILIYYQCELHFVPYSCHVKIYKKYLKYLYIIMVVFIVLPFKITVQRFYCNTVINIIMLSKNRLRFIAYFFYFMFSWDSASYSCGNHCNSQPWKSEMCCIFHIKINIYEMTCSMSIFQWCNGDRRQSWKLSCWKACGSGESSL